MYEPKGETSPVTLIYSCSRGPQLIRLDMSEYMTSTAVTKITGSAPGYVGYNDNTSISFQVRKKPYSVVLLDEIEKAHKDVLNVFLQIFDEGRMSDTHGRFVDFRNTIIIMTSNIIDHNFKKGKLGFVSSDDNEEEEGLKEISARLLAIAKAEEHHEERYKKILKEVEANTVFQKEEDVEWMCRECGYVHTGKTPPEKCPSCNHAKSFFMLFNISYC